MIELTKLNGSPIWLNGDLVRYAEASPDTVLTLVTGEKMVVRESCRELRRLLQEHRADVLRAAWPEAYTAIAGRRAGAAAGLAAETGEKEQRRRRMDIASIGGLILAFGAILAAMMMEGGSIAQITQPTAAMIVCGGTAGAVMLQFPLSSFLAALKQAVKIFFGGKHDGEAVLKQIVEFANKARKSGIVSLDGDLAAVHDPFLKQALMLAVDGTEPGDVRKIMQLELDNNAEVEEKIPQVFEAAGGYSPTVGIIGAVLGLIQVMQHLDNIDEVGRGIATAFVATIYGVAVANLICLPAAGKLKTRHREEQMLKEMMLEGVSSILEGMNPRMMETKLRTFLPSSKPATTAAGGAAQPAEATA